MTNPKIVPCRMCKGRKGVVPPEIFGGSVRWIGCTTVGCSCTGPERTTEAEAIAAWNELMQPSAQASPEMQSKTVRVPVHIQAVIRKMIIGGRDVYSLIHTALASDGTMWVRHWEADDGHWRQINDLPQPATVETSDD